MTDVMALWPDSISLSFSVLISKAITKPFDRNVLWGRRAVLLYGIGSPATIDFGARGGQSASHSSALIFS